MATHDSLKSLVRQYIKTNGQNEITGQILQNVLIAMIDELGITIDPTPTKNSSDAVSSGGTFGALQQLNEINATLSSDGKIYNNYQAGDIYYTEQNSVRVYWVALADGEASEENPVTISDLNFYHAENATDAVRMSLSTKTFNIDAYTKQESDAKYQPKGNYQPAGDYATEQQLAGKANASDVYTKQESDTKYQSKGNYQPAGDYATEQQLAGKANASDVYTKSETYSKTELDNLITTPNQQYVSVTATAQTTAVTDVLPATGAADTIYRVGNWDGTQYDPTMYALFAWNGTSYVCLAVRSFVDEVYDVSVNHPDGQGNPTPYADLTAALGSNGVNIPADIRRGGMSIKFIQGNAQSSDNKYVQYRLMSDSFNTTVANWQGVDDKPIYTSKNLLVSSATAEEIIRDSYLRYSTDVNVNSNVGSHLGYFIKDCKADIYGEIKNITLYSLSVDSNDVKISVSYKTPNNKEYSKRIIIDASNSYITRTYQIDYFLSITLTYTTNGLVSALDSFTVKDKNIERHYDYDIINYSVSSAGNDRIPYGLVKSIESIQDITSFEIKNIRNNSQRCYLSTSINGTTVNFGNLGSKKSGEVVATWDNGKILLDFTHYTNDIDLYGGIFVNVDKIKKIQLPDTIDVSLKSSLSEMPEYSQVYSRWNDKDNSYYGSLNAQYLFNLPSFKTLHVFGKYKLTGIIPTGENALVTVGNKSQLILTNNGNGLHNNTQDPATYVGYTQVGWQSGDNVSYSGQYQRNFIGKSAFSVRYTGDITQSENQDIIAELVFSSNNYTFSIKHNTDNSVINSVTGSTGNRVAALINQLNNLPNIECQFYNAANHNVSELYVSSTPMLLVREVADGDTTVIDNPPAYFHYAIDRTEHTIEMFVSTEDGGKTYAAFDGKTIEFTTPALSDTTIKFGKLGVPVTWSDLHIRIDNQEDVEIVTIGSAKQLISNNNPKILILEGHGVDSCMDVSPGYISDDLAASTDRLLYLFEQLKIKGYTPISINDFLEWKLNNRELPKRCYTIIMDDFQLGNYMISDHRYPFSRYDVKPTLALIEDAHTRDDVMTFDSNQFTVGECLDAMKMNQWWQVSHGKHIRLGTVKMSEQLEHLNSCTYYCNKLGISNEVIVYPYGSYNNNLDALEHSNFKLGIAVVGNYYVCKANNNFYINRIDIGARTPIADIIAAIV